MRIKAVTFQEQNKNDLEIIFWKRKTDCNPHGDLQSRSQHRRMAQGTQISLSRRHILSTD
jgi:hypothetical protein